MASGKQIGHRYVPRAASGNQGESGPSQKNTVRQSQPGLNLCRWHGTCFSLSSRRQLWSTDVHVKIAATNMSFPAARPWIRLHACANSVQRWNPRSTIIGQSPTRLLRSKLRRHRRLVRARNVRQYRGGVVTAMNNVVFVGNLPTTATELELK